MRRDEKIDRLRESRRSLVRTPRERDEVRTEFDGVCGTRTVRVTREHTDSGEVESMHEIGSVSEPMS